MSTLDNIAIATIGYVCESRFNPLTRGTHGYICPQGDVPPQPPEQGGGGHGAVIQRPRKRPEHDWLTDEELAMLAVLIIHEGYD